MKTHPPGPDEHGAHVELTYPGAEPLYAERCKFRNPKPPFDESRGFETRWHPDLGEQRAVANGAPVILRVWGDGHPPVSVGAGNPDDSRQLRVLVDQRIYDRALGNLYGLLVELLGGVERDEPATVIEYPVADSNWEELDPDGFLALWQKAMERAIVQIAAEEAGRDTGGTNGKPGPAPSAP